MGSDRFLPYGRQVIEEDDIAAVTDVLRSDYLTTGPAVSALEKAFAATVGARHAIACANGTAALHLISMAHGIGEGTSVIVPSVTFLATASAPHITGCDIVFADVDPASGLMTPALLRDGIARAKYPVSAVFAVHLGGQVCDIPALQRLAAEAGATLLEDACHALGTQYSSCNVKHVVGGCAHSAAAAFSLHPVKTIAAGEGGIVTTNDDQLAYRMRALRSHGMLRDPQEFTDRELSFDTDGAPNPWVYEMSVPGLNYRLTDFQCALALSQLKKLPRFAEVRGRLAARYDALLRPLAPIIVPIKRVQDCEPVWHLYQVLIDFNALQLDRAALMRRLHEAGIGTQVHYVPVHRQPYWRKMYPTLALPGAGAFYARTLSLPLFASMDEGDVERVVSVLGAFVGLR